MNKHIVKHKHSWTLGLVWNRAGENVTFASSQYPVATAAHVQRQHDEISFISYCKDDVHEKFRSGDLAGCLEWTLFKFCSAWQSLSDEKCRGSLLARP